MVFPNLEWTFSTYTLKVLFLIVFSLSSNDHEQHRVLYTHAIGLLDQLMPLQTFPCIWWCIHIYMHVVSTHIWLYCSVSILTTCTSMYVEHMLAWTMSLHVMKRAMFHSSWIWMHHHQSLGQLHEFYFSVQVYPRPNPHMQHIACKGLYPN